MPSLFNRLQVPLLTVFFSLLIFFLLIKLLGPIPFTVNSITTQRTDLFSVNGTGEATARPDTAEFTVGVTKTAPSVDGAKNQLNTTINIITKSLKLLGIAEKNIKTQDFSVYPVVNYEDATESPKSYTASTTIRVTVNDTTLANKALDSATTNGANIVNGISFSLKESDKTKLEDKARVLAIKNAKIQAQKIAEQSGIKLGRVINISINPENQRPILYDKAVSAPVALSQPVTPPTQLEPGENTVSVSVTLYYETL